MEKNNYTKEDVLKIVDREAYLDKDKYVFCFQCGKREEDFIGFFADTMDYLKKIIWEAVKDEKVVIKNKTYKITDFRPIKNNGN